MTYEEANKELSNKLKAIKEALKEAAEFARQNDLYLSMTLPDGVGTLSYDTDEGGWFSSSEY